MTGKPKLWFLLSGLVAIVLFSSVANAAPLMNFLSLHRMEADPDKPYNLSEQNGPWTILVAGFSGEMARSEAHELVLELRKRYKLAAYVYEKKFKHDDDLYGHGMDRYGDPLKMRYQRGNASMEVAVMVGDYQTVDDPKAQETLNRLKYYQPECMKLKKDKPTSRSLAGLRFVQQAIHQQLNNGKQNKGPMGHAFVTTNPLLPKDYFAPKGLDKSIVALNEGNKYSLLDCPGKYTVQVARFTGQTFINQAEISRLQKNPDTTNKLIEAGEKAEKLAHALRKNGYEAYLFHDRRASIVTVGSFNSAGTPLPNGKVEINPEIHAIIKTFSADKAFLPGRAMSGFRQKKLVGIPFDIQSIPVEVPRRSIASDYSRSSTGRLWGRQ